MQYPYTEGNFSVLLADSNRLLGEGLTLILNDLDHKFSIIDQQNSLINLHSAFENSSPKIILAELFSGESQGITELQDFLSQHLDAKIIVYSFSNDKEHVLDSFKHGAIGYLSKGADIDTVTNALHTVAQGNYFIDPSLAKVLIREVQQLHEKTNGNEHFSIQIAEPGPDLLTKRELEIVRLLTQGKNNRSIGELLQISEKTVKNHISKILSKLDLVDRTQIVLKAIKSGWVAL